MSVERREVGEGGVDALLYADVGEVEDVDVGDKLDVPSLRRLANTSSSIALRLPPAQM